MELQRMGGIVLLIVGGILTVVGLSASDSAADQLSNFFTGNFTDRTVWYLVGGIALAVAGLLLVVFRGRSLRT